MSYEDIDYSGLTFRVEYSYQPYEAQELYHPGCPESFDIEGIKLGDFDMMDFFQENDLIEEMNEFLVDQIKGR